MNRKSLATLAAAVLFLAACSNDSPTNSNATGSPASSSPTAASPSPSASTTPEPSSGAPTPAAADPCTDPSVSPAGLPAVDFDRYQFFCIGMSFDEASAATDWQTVVGDAACPWYSTLGELSDYGFHVGAMTRPDDPGADIYLFRMTWTGTPADVAAMDPPATAANISLGSTIAEVMAAYPDASAVAVDDTARGPRNHLLVTGPSGGTYDFDVTDGYVTDMYWGMNIPQGVNGELCAL